MFLDCEESQVVLYHIPAKKKNNVEIGNENNEEKKGRKTKKKGRIHGNPVTRPVGQGQQREKMNQSSEGGKGGYTGII